MDNGGLPMYHCCREYWREERYNISKDIPNWVGILALDIYKIIQKYNAMPRFQEMVNLWAEEHEAEIRKRMEWEKRRRTYFEETVATDVGLQDKHAAPSEEGWKFELHVQRTVQESGSHLKHTSNPIWGWVPPELSTSATPEVKHILPLNREHELSLAEKYTILAGVYDYGRKGTQDPTPWQWPGSDDWHKPDALSNAERCIFFHALRESMSELEPHMEGWLRALLKTVEEDVAKWANVRLPQQKEQTAKIVSETTFDGLVRRAKNHPVISIAILVVIVLTALGTTVEKFDSIVAFCHRLAGQQQRNRGQMEMVEDQRIVTTTAKVEITIRSEEQVNARHPYNGAVLAFGKGTEALLTLSSVGSTAKQTGMGEVRYSSNLAMEATDKAFKQPLSFLQQIEYVHVRFDIIPPNSEVLSGTVVCIFNNTIPIELSVPSQKMRENFIRVSNIDFAEGLRQHTRAR